MIGDFSSISGIVNNKMLQKQHSDFHCTSLFSASHADEFRLPLPVGVLPSLTRVFLLATLRSKDFHSSCNSSSESTFVIGINGAYSSGRVGLIGGTGVSCFGTEDVQKLFPRAWLDDGVMMKDGILVTLEKAFRMRGITVSLQMDFPAM